MHIQHVMRYEMKNPLTDTASLQMQAITKQSIALFDCEYTFNGMRINAAICHKVPVVRDRIEAVQWSKGEFGGEDQDAVIACLAAKTMTFGYISDALQIDEKGALVDLPEIKGEIALPPDFIVDNFVYSDFCWMSLSMGKESASATSKKNSCLQQSRSSDEVEKTTLAVL